MLIRLHNRYFINTDFVKWINIDDSGTLKVVFNDGSIITTEAKCIEAVGEAQQSLIDYCKKQK